MINNKTLTILVIEDDTLYAELIRGNLGINNFNIHVAGKLSEGIALISQNKIDAILLDLQLPDSHGFDTFETVQKVAPQIPIIILSGMDDEELILNSLQKGAQDYLLKGEVNNRILQRALRYAIERKQSEQKLKEALELNQQIFSTTSFGILTYMASGQCIFANEAAAIIINTSVNQLLNQNFHSIESWKKSGIYELARDVMEKGISKQQDFNFLTSFGREVWLDIYFASFSRMGESHLLIILNDKTNKKYIEKDLEWKNYLMDLLMQNTPNAIYFKDLKGRIREASKYMATKLGFDDVNEIIGKTDFDLFSLQHATQAYQDEHKILSLGEGMYNFEEKETYPDKPDTWAITSKMPLYNAKGELIGTFGISRDITESKIADEALRRSKAQLAEAMDVAQLYHWAYDSNGSFFVFNEKLWKFLGNENAEPGNYQLPILEYLEKFVYPEDKYIVVNDRKKAQDNIGQDYFSQIEYRIVRLDGHIRHIMVRTRVELNEVSQPKRFYGILQDITDRKIAIQKAFEALNQVDIVKTEVLSLISQEIRTPLNGIVGAVNLIKNQEYSSAIKDLVEILDNSVSNLESFTDNAIYYSKLTKNFNLNLFDFNLKEIVQFAVLENENAITEKKLKIIYNTSLNSINIKADKDLIYKAITNILKTFIDNSKHKNSISIAIYEEDKSAFCIFNNTESAFPDDVVRNYASLGGMYNNRHIGLSLFIVKQIMDLHNGDIKIFNHESAGATIKLSFQK